MGLSDKSFLDARAFYKKIEESNIIQEISLVFQSQQARAQRYASLFPHLGHWRPTRGRELNLRRLSVTTNIFLSTTFLFFNFLGFSSSTVYPQLLQTACFLLKSVKQNELHFG